jgi:AraC-like DNA-binding protein
MTAKLAMNSISMPPILPREARRRLERTGQGGDAAWNHGRVLSALPDGEVVAPAGPAARWRPRRPELVGVVAAVWTTVVPAEARTLRVLPDAAVDLVFAGEHLAVAGPDTGPCLERLPSGRVIGLQLHPAAVPALLGVPAAAVRDARVPLSELWGAAGRDLADALASRRDGPAEVGRLAGHLEAACARRMTRDAALPPLANALRRRLAGGRPLDLRELGTSERQLRRTCTAAYGYGPRTLRRVVRFQSVLDLLAQGDAVGLSEIAYRTGYADQAHLTREVGALSGLTPTALRAALAPGPS